MCTSIVEVVSADGAGKGGDGWFDLTHSVVSYDHPHHALLEEAITIDFVNAALGPEARVAVELTLESAKELSAALAKAIAAAEIRGLTSGRRSTSGRDPAASLTGQQHDCSSAPQQRQSIAALFRRAETQIETEYPSASHDDGGSP